MYDHGGMNRFYRLVWSVAKQAYVPIPEMSNKRGKRKGGVFASLAAAAIALLSAATGALADPGPHAITPMMHAAAPAIAASTLPTGGQVVGGAGTIATSGTTQTITQTSQNLAINWSSFSIGKDGKVIFNQPDSSAIALNRVLGGDASQIFGQLQANGQVFLINPNGILFAKGSQVSAAGILASTRDMSVADFMAGHYHLTGTSSAGVTNDGTLTAAAGGYIALVGAQVINDGNLAVEQGDVRLAAGDDVTVRLDKGSLLDLTIAKGAYDSLVSNGGIIRADGGRIYLTADALDALSKASVNNTGLIEAETVDNVNGHIVLKGDMGSGTVTVAGTLDASAPNGGDGGAIETSAAHVSITSDATITTQAASGSAGNWLIDPVDFTVAASGGDMTGTALTTALTNGNIQIESSNGASGTNGDINIDDTVSWSAHTLTLTAANNVNINAVMAMTGTASVDFEPATANGGQSAVSTGIVNVGMDSSGNFLGKVNISSTGTVTIGGQVYTVINSLGSSATDTTAGTLQGMQGDLTGHYVLGSDINASATSTWNSGAGFTPIGATWTNPFTGSFDGLGHAISGLSFNTYNWTGTALFGGVSGSSGSPTFIGNVAMTGLQAQCYEYCAGLVGYVNQYTTIQNVSVTGSISGDQLEYDGFIAGEVESYNSNGPNFDSNIVHAYASGTITSEEPEDVGGLVGELEAGNITNGHATVTMNFAPGYYSDGEYIGGLVGEVSYGGIYNSDANATINLVSGSVALSNNYGEYEEVGGLVGVDDSSTGSISNSHATGSIISTCAVTSCSNDDEYVGGLVGEMEGSVGSSYAAVAITLNKNSNEYVGGLFGGVYDGTISDSYATGAVSLPGTDNYHVGGFAGEGYSVTVSNAYSTGQVSTGDDANYVGGFWGYDNNSGDIFTAVHATGDVIVGENSNEIGGLFGVIAADTVTQAYATGNVTAGDGAYQVGGLIGNANGTTLDTAFSTGNVVAGSDGSPVGGLIGEADSATLSNIYATGSVTSGTSSDSIGGLIGYMAGGTLTTSYSSGAVSVGAGSTVNVGGLLGAVDTYQTVTDSFWDTTTSGQSTSAGASGMLGLTTAQIQQQANFTSATSANGSANPNWDFGSTWVMYSGNTAPLLQAFMTPLTISVSGTKTYDGTMTGGVLSYSTTPDTSHLLGTQVVSGITSKNAGTYAVTASGFYSDQLGYLITYVNGSLVVSAKTITVTGTGVDRAYDGTQAVDVSLASSGVINGDDVTFAGTGAMSTKDAGNGKSVSITGITDGGNDASNYILANTTASGTVNIAKANLMVDATGVNKTYDGTTSVGVTLSSDGVVNGDSVAFSDTSSLLANKNAGSNKTVTVSGISLSGTDAGNYNLLDTSTTTTANVAKANLMVDATGVNKIYDGTTSVGVTLSSDGVVSGDTVTFADTSSLLADKNAGTNKTVTVAGISLSGSDAGNYNLLDTSTTTTANVAKANLMVDATGVNKTYDGTTSVGVTLSSDGVVNGDNVSFSDTSSLMANKNAGSNKTVTVSGIGLSGTDAGNYSLLDTSTTTTVNVAKAALYVDATGINKTYDGTTSVGVTLSSDGVVNGDSVAFSDTSSLMADKNVGSNKTVTVSGIGLSGTDAGNYNLLDTSTTTTANVAKANLMVDATGIDKTYDGTTAIGVTLSSDGVVNGDNLTFSDTSSLMADKNAGSNKTVTVSGISLSGTDAVNYNLIDTSTTTTANVAKAALFVDAVGIDKTYDGTTAIGVTLSSDGVVNGDNLTFSDTSSLMADKNAGSNKTVTVSGISLSGTDAANYNLIDTSTTTTANVAKAALFVDATGINKTYDGTTSVGVTLSSDGVVSGDQVTFSDTSSLLADKNAGSNKTVTVSGIGLSGTDAGNYNLLDTSTTTTANVAKAALFVDATGSNKTYDGTTAVGVTLSSDGVVNGDSVAFSDTSSLLADKNAGSNKTVTVSGIGLSGTDAGNYNLLDTSTTTTANVAKANLIVDATGNDKTYDGSASVAVTLSSDSVVNGDNVTFSDTSSLMADKNAGANKSVTVSGIGLSGSDAGNYNLLDTSTTTMASIAKKSITATGTGVDRTYDGTTSVGVDLTSNGVVSGDSVSFSGSGTLADKNAGTGKAVAITGITDSGADASNYALANTAGSTTVDIAQKSVQVALVGPITKVGDGSTSVTLTSANYVVSGLVSGDTLSVTQGSGQFTSPSAGTDMTVSAALTTSSYAAGSGTVLGNYVLYVGNVSANIGEIDNPATPSYQAALTSVPTVPASSSVTTTVFSTIVGSSGPATSTGDGDNAVATDDKSGNVNGDIASMQTHDALAFHRTFSIADGGIKLPSGVDDTDTSTAANGGQ